MTSTARRSLSRGVVSAGVALALCWAAVAPADAHGPTRTISTDVTVAVDRDGDDRARSTLQVARTSASEVSAVNVAGAWARCDDCRAVALSFQVVVADRAPDVVDADNAALAVNEACERCETVAIAYQFVVLNPGRAHLTGAGHARLAQVRHALWRLSRSGGTAEAMAVEAEALAAEVAEVLSSELLARPRVDREVRGRH